ncbi:MAG: hypothetical protein JSR60_02145 [Proteobacteria bacterium]|nr:hypothetical protein [Pseudomonadota bacterium]
MLKPWHSKPLAAALASAMLLSSCATTGTDGSHKPRTALERSIGQCILSVGVGALVGALLGGAINRRGGAGTGAAIGAGAGAVACAVILAVNNEKDRERIRQNEQAAYTTGKPQTARYVSDDGSERYIKTSVQTLPTPQAGTVGPNGETITGPCRRAQTTISITGKGSAALDSEVVCRTAQGDYIPVDHTAA